MRKHIEDLEKAGFHFGPLAKDNGTIAATSATRNESVNATKKDWSAADMTEFQRIMSSNNNGQNDNNKTTAGLPYEPTAILNQNQHHGQSQGQYRIRPRDIIDWTGR